MLKILLRYFLKDIQAIFAALDALEVKLNEYIAQKEAETVDLQTQLDSKQREVATATALKAKISANSDR